MQRSWDHRFFCVQNGEEIPREETRGLVSSDVLTISFLWIRSRLTMNSPDALLRKKIMLSVASGLLNTLYILLASARGLATSIQLLRRYVETNIHKHSHTHGPRNQLA